MRSSARLFALSIAIVAAATSHPVAAAEASVEVHDNFFAPDVVEIDTGDSVTWVAVDGGHTVRSEDEVAGAPLFEFPAGEDTLRAGDRYTHVFSEPGTYRFRCEIHAVMTGAVYVDTEPPSRPARRVPAEYPTIGAALSGAPAGTTIEIAPGRYAEQLTIDQADVTLRGTGTSPSDVVLDGGGMLSAGIVGFADGIRVEGLTVERYTSLGVSLNGADRFRIHRVHAVNNGGYGIAVRASRGGGVTDSVVHGSRTAGLLLADCDTCGSLVEHVTATQNGAGILVRNADDVYVFDSTIHGNSVGVVVESVVPEPAQMLHRAKPPTIGATIMGNALSENGTGVAIRGGWHVAVERNTISGGVDAVVVTGVPIAPISVAVMDNEVTEYAGAGLRWDLVGIDVCFARNSDPRADSAEPVTEPPSLQLLFPC